MEPKTNATTPIRRLRSLSVVFVTPLIASVAIAVGQVLHRSEGGAVPVIAVIGALLAIVVAAATPLLRRVDRAAPTIAALALAASAIVLGYHAERAVDYAITSTYSSGLDALEVEVVMPWTAFVVFLAGMAAFTAFDVFSPAVLRRALRAFAAVILACGAAAVVFGAARTRSRPAAGDYVTSLPVIGTLGPMTTTGEHWIDRYGAGYPVRQPIAPDEDHVFDGIYTRRSCDDDGCWIQILTSPTDDPRGHRWSIHAADRIVLRRDRAHDLLVFDYDGSRLWLDGTTADYAIPRIPRAAIGPPLRWVSSGALAVLVAAILFAWRPAPVGRARRAEHGKSGVSDGKTVTFDDGTPPFASIEPVAAGPVIVVPTHTPARATFREVGAIRSGEVLEGTHADLARAADLAVAGRAALAIAVVAIACAPLFAS